MLDFKEVTRLEVFLVLAGLQSPLIIIGIEC